MDETNGGETMTLEDRAKSLFFIILSVGMTASLVDTYRAEFGYIRWAASVHQSAGTYWAALVFCTACTLFVYAVTWRHYRRR